MLYITLNMRKLGLIGGTSWHSTIEYYREINTAVNNHFGDNTNPPLLVYTLNQSKIHRFQTENKWGSIAEEIVSAAQSLIRAGAEKVILCANTPHKVYHLVQRQIKVPILHIGDAIAKAISAKGIRSVCFIGTKFSMTDDFVTGRISSYNIDVLVPDSNGVIDELHRIIQEELTYGKVIEKSKTYVLHHVDEMVEKGAQGVVLGCTEFPLMIADEDLNIPSFNTTKIHAQAAVDFILK